MVMTLLGSLQPVFTPPLFPVPLEVRLKTLLEVAAERVACLMAGGKEEQVEIIMSGIIVVVVISGIIIKKHNQPDSSRYIIMDGTLNGFKLIAPTMNLRWILWTYQKR